jgi:restriction system protein
MAWRQGPQVQRLDLDIGERTSRGAIVGRVLRTSPPQRQREPEQSTRPEPPETWCADVFDIIEWRRFESVVEALFAQAGFETRSQPCGADGGIDIWLHSKNRGGAAVSIVQCKHWSAWKVGVKPVRELRGVMAAHGIARGQFVTTSRYTADARSFAKDNGIMLHDTYSLLALIGNRDPKQQQELLRVALYGQYWRPTCANCGLKLVERTAHESGKPFWGCRSYPKCKTMIPMRRDGPNAKSDTGGTGA